MMIGWAIASLFCAGCGFLWMKHRERVEAEVKAGRLRISLGEGLDGPSYQIGMAQVFGFCSFALAVFCFIALLVSIARS